MQPSGEKSCKEGSWALSGGADTSESILRVEKKDWSVAKSTSERSVF